MSVESPSSAGGEGEWNPRLAILLAMAMFVLVVDTTLMNVSISAVVEDLGTTVSDVQAAIALEAPSRSTRSAIPEASRAASARSYIARLSGGTSFPPTPRSVS